MAKRQRVAKPNLDIMFFLPWILESFQTKSNFIYNNFLSYIEGVKLFLWRLFFYLRHCHEKKNVDSYESYKCWNICSKFIYKISILLLKWLGDCWNVISWEGKFEWIENYVNELSKCNMLLIKYIMLWLRCLCSWDDGDTCYSCMGIVPMCGDELTISIGKIFVVENDIHGRMSFMAKLYLIKATWGSRLVGIFPSTTPMF